jgi:hypothetical protein
MFLLPEKRASASDLFDLSCIAVMPLRLELAELFLVGAAAALECFF